MSVGAWASVLYDDGSTDVLFVTEAEQSAAVTSETFSGTAARMAGWVLGAGIYTTSGVVSNGLRRGDNACALFLGGTGTGASTARLEAGHVLLARGYIWNNQPIIPLGRIEDLGPGGGAGNKRWVALADDIAPVDVTRVLGLAGVLRKIYGYLWYYNAAVVAVTRTLDVVAQSFGPSTPTGFTTANSNVELQPQVSLTTGQEAMLLHLANEGGSTLRVSSDNGVQTIQSTDLRALFPYYAEEADLAQILFDVGAADATDRHSIFLLEEEWVRL